MLSSPNIIPVATKETRKCCDPKVFSVKMKTKDKISNNKDKDKKIILWEVKSFQAIEINKREDLEEEDQGEDEMGRRVHP